MNRIFPALSVVLTVIIVLAIVEVELRDNVISIQDDLIDNQRSIISEQEQTITRLNSLLSDILGREYRGEVVYSMEVTATAYTAREAECNDEPWITANGKPSRVGAIAISRDLETIGINLGDLVIIKGMGLFRVEDRMNKRFTKRIDILHAHLKAARMFGKQNLEIMWFGEKGS